MPVAQVPVEIGEEGWDLQLGHFQLGAGFQPFHGAPPGVVEAGTAVGGSAGPSGEAPAVVPWLGGVR